MKDSSVIWFNLALIWIAVNVINCRLNKLEECQPCSEQTSYNAE